MIKRKLVWIIIGFGIILRLTQYLYNRSLWLDEARDVLIGILGRSFSEIFQPPPPIFTPTPPAGFLVIEKLAVQMFGNNEYALRLFPLLAGILSLFLFYLVAKKYLKPNAVLIALSLYAILDPLIYYSSEVKHYTTDNVIAILIFISAIYIQSERLSISRIALFGMLGMIAVWFSGPAVFILAGVGVSLFLFSLNKKEWAKIGSLSIVYSLWILSFVVCYLLYLRYLTHNEYIINSMKGENAFMPFPNLSLSWFITTFFDTFGKTARFPLPGIAAFAFLMGCLSMFLEKKERFFILISPALFALLASALYLYPLKQRMLLFMIPSLLLFIGEGAEFVRDKTVHHSPLIGIVLIGLLLFQPLLSASYHLINPRAKEEIKTVLNYVRKHWQQGDIIYLHYRAHPAFMYYSKKYGFNEEDYIVGVYAGEKNNLWTFSPDYLRVYTEDLDKLRGNKRVWILFTETPLLRKGIDERVFFIYYLNQLGKQLDSFEDVGAAVYLYDLSIQSIPRIDKREKTLHWNF
jgi:hypothetical protein